jgi:predicted nucleotidyltransferase
MKWRLLMDKKIKEALLVRNERIIQAVIEKSRRVCLGSVALIGIYGSFASDDIHEKSDLDLFIVINDPDGYKIASCFILGDVAHDVYCTTWEQLEEMARYSNPYISRLVDLKIVYCPDDKYRQKFLELRDAVGKRLASPFDESDLQNIKVHFEEAQRSYADVMMSKKPERAKYASARLIHHSEMIVYLMSKSYVRLGVKRMPEEIERLQRLPSGFLVCYRLLVESDSLRSIKKNATSLIRCIRDEIEEIKSEVHKKKRLDRQALEGSYEEIHSDWKNKMWLAEKVGSKYLSLMTAASCQLFYDQMGEEYEGISVDLMKSFDINDLQASAMAFDEAMEKYKLLYDKVGVNVKRYATIDEFEDDYRK